MNMTIQAQGNVVSPLERVRAATQQGFYLAVMLFLSAVTAGTVAVYLVEP
jgi:hypothetical protein